MSSKVKMALNVVEKFYEHYKASGRSDDAAFYLAYGDAIVCFTFDENERAELYAKTGELKKRLVKAFFNSVEDPSSIDPKMLQ